MEREKIIEETMKFIYSNLKDVESGHSLAHTLRVWKMAKYLAKGEKVDLLIVELGALMHSIADYRFQEGNDQIGPLLTGSFLLSLGLDEELVNHVKNIVKNIGFNSRNFEQKNNSLEIKIVIDADKLDALGAIGIARIFHEGGQKNRVIYDPNNKEKDTNASSINQFYSKSLLLKGLMNTKKAKKIAEKRHKFLEEFLKEFYAEWNYLDD